MAYKKRYKKSNEPTKSSSEKYSDYVEGFNDKMIALIEVNKAPWLRPWGPGEAGPGGGMPYNASTGKAYSGSNAMYLMAEMIDMGYEDARFLTLLQGNGLGARLRKGEKSLQLVKWVNLDEKKDKDAPAGDDEKDSKSRMFPSLFCVFHASQFDNLPAAPERKQVTEHERHETCERLLKDSGATILHNGGNRAFYRPGTDSIHLPERSQFKSANNLYVVALHELGHWSGHSSGLNRDLTGSFGSESYAKEELRAEISSMMIGESLQIGHDPSQHAAYVQHWLKICKEDSKAILNACKDAEKICNFLGVEKYVHEVTQKAEKTAEHTQEHKKEHVATKRHNQDDDWAPSSVPVPMAQPQPPAQQQRARVQDFGMSL